MSWAMATLGELCEINIGRTPARANPEFWGQGEPWLSIADMNQGPLIRYTKEQITNAGAKAGRRVPAGTVLLSFKLSIGKVALAGIPLFTNEAIAALPIKDSERIDARYLARALRIIDLVGDSNRAAMGATLNKATLARVRIPLPPLQEQLRIISILDQVDALRVKRRQILAHFDVLAQAMFYEMFGTVGNNRWRKALLSELVGRIDSGRSPNCESRKADADEWGVLKLGAVTYGTFQAAENKAFIGEVGSMSVNEVRAGDVLMTRKNTRELVGAVALVDEVRPRLLLPDLIFRLQLDVDRIDRHYFHALMMNPAKRSEVRDLSSGSAASMPNISKSRLLKLPIDLPPLYLQHDFAAKVSKMERQRDAAQRALAVDDELFTSLQTHAFHGKL